MRVAIADNNSRKFTDDLIKHWEKKHEVKYETGASEYLAQWADIYYIDEWDNNLSYLYKLYHNDTSVTRPKDWDNNKKPMIVCRPLDWTIWIGYVRDQKIIDWVDKAITIAPHLERKLRAEANWGDKLKLIRPGVNMEKFTLKKKKTDGFQVGMVLGDMWWMKQHMGGLDIFASLAPKDPRWKLHIRGQHEPGEYNPVMYEHYLESRGIKDRVTLYPRLEDMNAFYEDIDYLLHPGMKEGFCYAVAEAMSKGIKPVVNNFYGAKDIWYDEILYNTHKEALMKFTMGSPINANSQWMNGNNPYREYIKENYDVKRMLEEYDKYLGL